jgi:hypothetical protein
MIRIDQDTQWINMTRADTENIVFGAKDKITGEPYVPTVKDRLIFSAAKKVGDDPLVEIVNEMDDDVEAFWNIRFEPEDTESLSFGKYAYNVELQMRNSVTGELTDKKTIIGKTDTLSPTLVIWGEVGRESE